DAVVGFLRQPLPVGDEFRPLPSEHEVLRRLVAPGAHRLERRRTIERAVDLGGGKPASIPAQPVLFRDIRRIERPAPAVIGPARGADEHLFHNGFMRRRPRSSSGCNRALAVGDVPTEQPKMSRKLPSLADFRRIVIKVGSSLLVDADAGGVKEAWLASLAADIAALHGQMRDILVASSGAIALGRSVLKLPKGALRLEDSQAAAAVGQIALARTWSEALGRHGIGAGQVLVTLGDTEERRRYLNARNTIARLLDWRAVPVINENDTVATNEIRYGDNDRLAARVATMASADVLVLLSDVDGLYDAPPDRNSDATLIPLVERITPQIEAMAG